MKTIPTLALTGFLMAGVEAAPRTFDFKDPKGVSNAEFKLVVPLETIKGTSNGISGTVTVDLDNPAAAKGRIVVLADTLTVPNPKMNEHLLSADWLDAKKFKEIAFELKGIANVKKEGDTATADISGAFTLHGVTKDLTVPAKFTLLPGKLAERTGGKVAGDLVVIRTDFQIKRSDFGIQTGQHLDKVSNDIDITLNIAGGSPKP